MSRYSLGGLLDRYFIKQPRLREAVTRLLHGRGDAEVTLFGQPFQISRLRENGYLRAARLSRHASLFRDEAVILQRLPLFCEDDMTFVDVGANIGIFSVCLAAVKKVRRNFAVMAFEVHPDTFSRLERNAARHGFTAIRAAISDKLASLTFVSGAVSHVTTTVDKANAYNIASRTFDVDARRLDSFDFSGSVFIKIDVEGQELNVLRGASALFDAGRVRGVYIDGYGSDPGVLEFFRERDFDLRDCRTLDRIDDHTFSLLALAPQSSPDRGGYDA